MKTNKNIKIIHLSSAAFCIIALSHLTVFATDTTYQQIEVTYSQPSTFSVNIPKQIALDSNKQSKYSVQVNGDIAFNQEVSVTPVDEIEDTEAIDFYTINEQI